MDASSNHEGDRSPQGLTLQNPFHRISLLPIVLWLVLGVSALSHAQRFVRPINTIDALIASNPNDPHTNVFIPQGPGGPGIFYQWRKNDTTATNDNQSVLGTDWPGAVGRWLKIPIQQGSVGGNTGISNPGTNGFAVVNTLADLRNIPGNLGIGMVYIRGHSQAYDWGQGFFSRVDDCSTPDDDGLTSAHGNDELTCWTRENRFPWSGTPVQYAGGTVTRTLINTVSQYLSTQGGGTVFITDGQWAIDTTNGPIILRNSVSIAGSASAVLVGDGYGTMFAGTNIHNAQILEVGISNVVNGVEIRGGTNILIGGNSFFKVGDGVRQYGGDDVRIEVNRFAEITNGIHFSLDGATQVTHASTIGNTYSGVVNQEILEDPDSIGIVYHREDSVFEFRPVAPNYFKVDSTGLTLIRSDGSSGATHFLNLATNSAQHGIHHRFIMAGPATAQALAANLLVFQNPVWTNLATANAQFEIQLMKEGTVRSHSIFFGDGTTWIGSPTLILSNTATVGFPWIRSMDGSPTGTLPTASTATNQVAITYDDQGNVLWIWNAQDASWHSVGGGGDVFGPASSTDDAIATFDGVTGKLIQNSLLRISGGLLQFEGTSSSFPALTRSANGIVARLADDSNYADITGLNIVAADQFAGPGITTIYNASAGFILTTEDLLHIGASGAAHATLSYTNLYPVTNAVLSLGFPGRAFKDAEFTGNVNVGGKLTATGGVDPPYLLLDRETRESVAAKVNKEVPVEKMGGAALFFNKNTKRLEVYVAEDRAYYSLNGDQLQP